MSAGGRMCPKADSIGTPAVTGITVRGDGTAAPGFGGPVPNTASSRPSISSEKPLS
jgi:hypothetical protein